MRIAFERRLSVKIGRLTMQFLTFYIHNVHLNPDPLSRSLDTKKGTALQQFDLVAGKGLPGIQRSPRAVSVEGHRV